MIHILRQLPSWRFRPTRLSIFYLGLAMVHIVGICVFWGRNVPGAAETWLAMTSPVGYESGNGTTKLYFNPLFPGSNPIPCYVVAALLAWWVSRTKPENRTIAIFGGAVAMMAVISFLLAIGASKAYWGYYFARPGVLREIYDVESVNAVIPVKLTLTAKGWNTNIESHFDSPDQHEASGLRYPYYCLEERLLLVLTERGLAPKSYGTTLDGIPPLHALLESSGMLAPSDPGYNSNSQVWGLVYDTVATNGERLIFLGLQGSEVSNDHRPFYELVYSVSNDTSETTFVGGNRFFFDVAGIEHAEWYVFWGIAFGFGALIAVPATVLALTPWGWLHSLPRVDGAQAD